MPSKLNLLSALMLAALLLCSAAAPLQDVSTESPTEEPSGEEEAAGPSDLLSASPVWSSILGATNRHKKEFEDEFHIEYHLLEHYKTSSLPQACPKTNFSKEACLHRTVQGLQIYKVLLKHVEKEYPDSLICTEAKYFSGLLINLIKGRMRNPEEVTLLTSVQEQKLLKDLDNPDTFHRKMTAHSILRELHTFVLDCKRAIAKREKLRGNLASRTLAPISFIQMLRR